MSWEIKQGDWIERLREMPDESVHCVPTSPPYWGLRDYGVPGQLGLEPTPAEYVSKMVEGFREVRRVLRRDGTLWLNLGDSYTSGGRDTHGTRLGYKQETNGGCLTVSEKRPECPPGLKPKDLVGIPWMVAFALRGDGWYLRQDIIWAKPNPMPESVTDRCTKSHEYLFLLSRSPRYYYDVDSIREPLADSSIERLSQDVASQRGSDRVPGKTNGTMKAVSRGMKRIDGEAYGLTRGTGNPSCVNENGANKRSVWAITTLPYSEAHFATFPPKLVEPCILAGCPEGGTVLDPFTGAGTTGLVALRYHRNFIGIEFKQEYCEMARRRIEQDAPLFNMVNA